MPDPTLNLSDSLNNWADSVSEVKELRKVLTDNLNNWADAGGPVFGTRVTQLPVELMTQPTGTQVRVTQLPIELMLPTAGLLQLVLSDSLTITDSVSKILEKQKTLSDTLTMTDSGIATPSAPLLLTLSDSWNNWSDLVSTRTFVQIQLTVSDSWNSWLDAVSTFVSIPMRRVTQLPVELMIQPPSQVRVTQLPVEVMFPTGGLMQLVLSDNLNNWLSVVSQAIVRTSSFSDSLSMTDSERTVLGMNLVLSDQMTLTDDLVTVEHNVLQLNLTVSDSWNTWSDSVTTQTTVLVNLNLTLSDTLNFWQDSFAYNMPVAPRTPPVGEPTDNCCPPNIWISD